MLLPRCQSSFHYLVFAKKVNASLGISDWYVIRCYLSVLKIEDLKQRFVTIKSLTHFFFCSLFNISLLFKFLLWKSVNSLFLFFSFFFKLNVSFWTTAINRSSTIHTVWSFCRALIIWILSRHEFCCVKKLNFFLIENCNNQTFTQKANWAALSVWS